MSEQGKSHEAFTVSRTLNTCVCSQVFSRFMSCGSVVYKSYSKGKRVERVTKVLVYVSQCEKWEVTQYMYSSTVLNFKVLLLNIILLYTFTPLHLFISCSYFAD